MRFAAESTPRCGALHGRAALVRITFEKSYTHYKRVSSPTPPPPKIFINVVCSEGAAARGRMSLKGSLPGGKRRSAEQAVRAPRPNGKRIKLHPQAAYRRGIREQAEYQANGACSQHSICQSCFCQRVSGARCVRQHSICQSCFCQRVSVNAYLRQGVSGNTAFVSTVSGQSHRAGGSGGRGRAQKKAAIARGLESSASGWNYQRRGAGRFSSA